MGAARAVSSSRVAGARHALPLQWCIGGTYSPTPNIITSDEEYAQIAAYVENNPANWANDRENRPG
jgi:hypothetical protein